MVLPDPDKLEPSRLEPRWRFCKDRMNLWQGDSYGGSNGVNRDGLGPRQGAMDAKFFMLQTGTLKIFFALLAL